MHEQTKNLINDIERLFLLSNKSSTKRSVAENDELENLSNQLHKNWYAIFEEYTKRDFDSIKLDEISFVKFDEILMDKNTRPYNLGGVMSKEVIEGAIQHTYSSQATISAQYEILSAYLSVYEQIYDRAKNIFKALHQMENEWRNDALFELALPKEFAYNYRRIKEYHQAYKIRNEQLESSRRDISRLLSLYISDNEIEPISKKVSVDSTGLSSGKSFRNRFKS